MHMIGRCSRSQCSMSSDIGQESPPPTHGVNLFSAVSADHSQSDVWSSRAKSISDRYVWGAVNLSRCLKSTRSRYPHNPFFQS
jgi:hypothetical protein